MQVQGEVVGYPLYYLKAFTEAPPLPTLVHVHASVFTVWVLFFFGQTVAEAKKGKVLGSLTSYLTPLQPEPRHTSASTTRNNSG